MTNGSVRRLDGWKAIADFSRTSVRTVQRWEREGGMPIHRIGALDRGAVYAFEAEILDWLVVWCRRSHGVERVEPVEPDVPAAAANADRSPWLTRAISQGAPSPRLMAGLLGVIGACVRFLRMRSPAPW